MYYVYILLCADDSPYTGFSEDLRARIHRHVEEYVPATKNRLPVKLVFYCAFTDEYEALKFEKPQIWLWPSVYDKAFAGWQRKQSMNSSEAMTKRCNKDKQILKVQESVIDKSPDLIIYTKNDKAVKSILAK